MKKKSFFKKLWQFLVDNYFISIFFASIAFVGVVSIYKLFFTKPTFVYAKVKVGQGLWWASTQKPSIWYIGGFKKVIENQETEKELTGQPQTQILSMRYYPTYINIINQNQYDVYLIMKLKVSKLGKTGKYNFKRSSIGVSSPVDFEFPSLQFSGTIIEISEKPIKDELVEKEITLTKKAVADFWEYEAIKVGDSYFDGKEKVFEIIDKYATDTQTLTRDASDNYFFQPQQKKYIFVKAKIKVKKDGNKLIFGEEQIVSPGKTINIATDNFQFQDYLVAQI